MSRGHKARCTMRHALQTTPKLHQETQQIDDLARNATSIQIMASSFSRASNRRSANISGTRSRLSTSLAEDYVETPPYHEDVPPKEFEEAMDDRTTERTSKLLRRDLSTTERRNEKRSVVTREKVVRRSPVKDSSSAGNRLDDGRQRDVVDSPKFRRKQRDTEER